MLNEVDEFLDAEKRADLVQRLNNKRVEQALPAEMELALIWALRDCEHIEIEPAWWVAGRRPDLYVEGLLPDSPAVIEIAATTDNSISGEEVMDRCAQEIIKVANYFSKGSGEFLYFTFSERRKWVRGKSVRVITAPRDYKISQKAKERIYHWLGSGESKKSKLTLVDGDLYVVIEGMKFRQIRYRNIFTSRPPRTYSETNNPIYKLLAKKLFQVDGAPFTTKKFIFLADVGSRTLADIGAYKIGSEQHATAEQIIGRFLSDKSGRVDGVVVFSPEQRHFGNFRRQEPRWKITVFSSSYKRVLISNLDKFFSNLPPPNFSGPQARSLFRQGRFTPTDRGWYLGSQTTMSGKETTFRISARALMDFLAGRISEAQFRHFVGDRSGDSLIQNWLNSGMTIQGARIVNAGIDNDDDHLEFDLAPDPSAKIFE